MILFVLVRYLFLYFSKVNVNVRDREFFVKMAWFILLGYDVKFVDRSVKNVWKWYWLS